MLEFEREIWEKRRIAAGARCKKGRRKGCTLPHERLSESQWRKRCGNVRVFRLNEPMSYEIWMEMSEDLQREYVKRLQQRYNAGVGKLAEMMGVSRQKLAAKLVELGENKGKKRVMSAEQAQAWKNWCQQGEQKEGGR